MDETEWEADEGEFKLGWLDQPMVLPRGMLIAWACLALSWKFDGTWGAFFSLAFFGLILWMLLGS